MQTNKVTRFEIIDHTPCDNCEGMCINPDIDIIGAMCPECHGTGFKGRTVVAFNKNLQFDVQLQDDDRTLKVFIHERYEDDENTAN